MEEEGREVLVATVVVAAAAAGGGENRGRPFRPTSEKADSAEVHVASIM